MTVAVLLRADQTSVLLSHVLLHLLIISVFLLADWSVDISDVLSAHEIELSFPFDRSIRLNQSCLISSVKITCVFIDGCDALCQLALLVQRGQEGDFFAHFREFE